MRISFDFDGVLCLTPFGRLATHAPTPVAPLPDNYERLYRGRPPRSALRLPLEYARFGWRRAAPDAARVVEDLSAGHELRIVTGRSVAGMPLLRRWLRRHGIDDCFAGLHMAPPGLRPAQHKLAIARLHAVDAHIDDDPRTAYHLANNGVPAVYLLLHEGAEVESPPAALRVVRSLREFAEAVGS